MNKELSIRSSAAEFLIFETQAKEDSIEVRYEDNTLWLTQKMMSVLYGIDVRTINDHIQKIFEDNELEEIADAIVKCKLKYQTTSTIDIHNSENDNFYLDYNIYEINVEEAIKGELKNKLLKIHISENVEIDEDKTYKLYLVQYENTPCSLVNIKQGISEVK